MTISTDKKSEDLDWQSFFQEYQAFTKKRDAQKVESINDYSLLASVLDVNDEVRLHSRFLYSILNPHGNHYQGSLFLKLFLNEIGVENNWLNYNNIFIAKERSGIDIHITDGHKHIIIENKLNAKDQEKQIQCYIEFILKFYDTNCSDIIFIYLSKNRQEPSKHGLGNFGLSPCKTKLVMPDTRSVTYMNAHYEKHIISWINKAKAKVINVQNLHNALSEYEKVVLKSIGYYRSKVMSIKDFIEDKDQLSSNEKIRLILSIEKELPSLYGYLLDKAMTNDIEQFMSIYPVEKVNDLQFPELTNHIFTEGTGREVITRYRCKYNKEQPVDIAKGSFWRITTGEYKDKLMLTLWMATYALHVGVIPISKKSDELFFFSNDVSFLDAVLDKVLLDGIKLEKRDNAKTMPVIISWCNEPEKELDQIYDFSSSRQGRTLSAIFEKLGITEKTTPSTP